MDVRRLHTSTYTLYLYGLHKRLFIEAREAKTEIWKVYESRGNMTEEEVNSGRVMQDPEDLAGLHQISEW